MITDASITAALLWPELAALSEIHGPADTLSIWQVTAGRWTITSHGAPFAKMYTTAAGVPREIPPRVVAVDWDGRPAGTIGPGETADIGGGPPEATAQRLRRDLHEHVYQYWRSQP
jgi:hypothetical protein